jgi:hypothetical protein
LRSLYIPTFYGDDIISHGAVSCQGATKCSIASHSSFKRFSSSGFLSPACAGRKSILEEKGGGIKNPPHHEENLYRADKELCLYFKNIFNSVDIVFQVAGISVPCHGYHLCPEIIEVLSEITDADIFHSIHNPHSF